MNFVSEATVRDVVRLRDNLHEYTLELTKGRRYAPGSFVQLTLEQVTASDIWPDSRTFSISSYEKGTMRFIIKNVGVYTNRIFKELTVGSRCTVKYPFGELFDKNEEDASHVFIAGGVGITPFIGLIEYYEQKGKLDRLQLFYSCRTKGDLLHLDQLSKALGERLHIFITREDAGDYNGGRISLEAMEALGVMDEHTNYYVCGSKEFNNDFSAKLSEKGYSKIHMDEWE